MAPKYTTFLVFQVNVATLMQIVKYLKRSNSGNIDCEK